MQLMPDQPGAGHVLAQPTTAPATGPLVVEESVALGRDHTGFFVQAQVGFGYLLGFESASTNFAGDLDTEFSGLTLLYSARAGWSVIPQLQVYAGIFGGLTLTADVQVNGQNALSGSSSASYSAYALGAGVEYYVLPLNLYVDATFGAGKGASEFNSDSGEDSSGHTNFGFAAELSVGKEFWLGPEFGLGAAAQFIFMHLPNDSSSGGGFEIEVGPDNVLVFGVSASATYN